MLKSYNVLIFGCGNIGFRHLQGVVKSKLNLNIYLYDIDEINSKKAIKNILNIKFNKKNKKIHLLKNFNQNISYDIVFVCNNAKNRFSVINNLLQKVKCKKMIIEKIAFLDPKDYNSCINLLKIKKIKAWINCNHQTFKSSHEISKNINKKNNFTFLVTGGKFNLISCVLHYLMFLNSINRNLLIKNITSFLSDPFESKRKNFYEMYGMIKIQFHNNINFIIYDNGIGLCEVKKEIITDKKIIRYTENGRFEIVTKNKCITKTFNIQNDYQSNLSNILVDNLILKNKCNLPTILDAKYYHKILFKILEKKLGKKNIKKYHFT